MPETHLQFQLCINIAYPTLLHHGPEGRIVEVIDVT